MQRSSARILPIADVEGVSSSERCSSLGPHLQL